MPPNPKLKVWDDRYRCINRTTMTAKTFSNNSTTSEQIPEFFLRSSCQIHFVSCIIFMGAIKSISTKLAEEAEIYENIQRHRIMSNTCFRVDARRIGRYIYFLGQD